MNSITSVSDGTVNYLDGFKLPLDPQQMVLRAQVILHHTLGSCCGMRIRKQERERDSHSNRLLL